MRPPTTRLECAGCGAVPDWRDPYPFRCPNADRADDVDHVLRRILDLSAVCFPERGDPNPFIAYRSLLHAYDLAMRGGLSDESFCALVTALDDRVAAVDGHGFSRTPFFRSAELSDALGLSDAGGVWVKDETGNVAGSHKARHLFNVLIQLEVAERLGFADSSRRRELAIASCGNAALAAAVVAAAGGACCVSSSRRMPTRPFSSACGTSRHASSCAVATGARETRPTGASFVPFTGAAWCRSRVRAT